MTTVFVLTLETVYEGETLMGVYATRQDAEAAGQEWLDEHEITLSTYQQWLIHEIKVGAAAVMWF